MDKRDIVSQILKIYSDQGSWRAKVRRNVSIYTGSRNVVDIDNSASKDVIGYNYNAGDLIQENVLKSCIDTLVSKIASQKVRALINTVGGSFPDMKLAKESQIYFDQVSDYQDWNRLVANVFRDAAVVDRGCIYINPLNGETKRIMPWQVAYPENEASYSAIKHIVWRQDHVPTKDLNKTETVFNYWDLVTHKHYVYYQERDKLLEEDWSHDIAPIYIMNYENPVKGSSANSIVDMEMGKQIEINKLVNTIKKATKYGQPLKYFLNTSSGIRANKIDNEVGTVYTYDGPPTGGTPIAVATEPFINDQYLNYLEVFRRHMSDDIGISSASLHGGNQLGAGASGVALATMEDIESDRFETQLNTVIRAYVELAKILLEIIDGNKEILPPSRYRSALRWKDLVAARDRMNIQFSAASALSKDPAMKLQTITGLYANGLLSKARALQLMEIPDLEQGYSFANNTLNAVLAVISDCIEKDEFDIPSYINVALLKEEIVNTCNSLRASQNEQNQVDIDKLMTLYQKCLVKSQDSMTNTEMVIASQYAQSMQQQMQKAMEDGSFEAAQNGNYVPGSFEQTAINQAMQNPQNSEDNFKTNIGGNING